ncbi:MAG: indolepyruvate ferredoxin oxidoreductase family protein [Alphaproteobacteria bacterium]|nr:indolepyruvate ferredoxin oxidoreductase family protein [Alphaproteobacteria bacterium]
MTVLPLSLDDKYAQRSGDLFLSAMQALVRLPMMQRQFDEARGLNTAGFVSGYRGSPVGGYDRELWRAQQHLQAHHVHFEPGLNEDLAATAIWGTQQLHLFGGNRYDGVFAIWYGKNPGLDRSGDAIRHANSAGTATRGGVLCVVGDDHTGKSSAFGVQSEYAFADYMMPVLNPASLQDIIDFGLFGFALSRFSGLWVGVKLAGSVAESSGTIHVPDQPPVFAIPESFALPAGGLNLRWPDAQAAQEERVKYHRLPAAAAFAQRNSIDRTLFDTPNARVGILTAGKASLDVSQALEDLGIDRGRAAVLGVRVRKLGLTWPIDRQGLHAFAHGLDRIIVVEEKRGFIEAQVKEALYGETYRPLVVGKDDETGRPLFRSTMEFESLEVASALARQLATVFPEDATIAGRKQEVEARWARRSSVVVTARTPYFCAGCPHNTSTRTPEGSVTIGGIGCHTLAAYMDRGVQTFTHMGGEGATWIGQAPFTDRPHVFQNVGDGTYTHSASLGIRAAVAAGVNITFKILYNDAVAMTGGQPVEGQFTVPQITRQLHAEGVTRIAVVSDEPEKYAGYHEPFASGVTVDHRDALDRIQRELRGIPGVSAIVYDQTCAAEKRRRRKRDAYPDPKRRVVINEQVCEGCGDCGQVSNCVAIVPVETEFGRKRQIDQSACNKDFSCLKGFCPSFVTVEGADLRRGRGLAAPPDVPEPTRATLSGSYSILVTGIGGTGVVTIGALLGVAARIDGILANVNDITGMAQKGGPVMSHVTLAPAGTTLAAIRVPVAAARVLIGADLVVSAMPDSAQRLAPGVTVGVVNTRRTMTGEFTRNPDQSFLDTEMRVLLERSAGAGAIAYLAATDIAVALTGDAAMTNTLLLGYSWQRGWIPLSRAAIEQAIRLNGARVSDNLAAFAWGRVLAHDPAKLPLAVPGPEPTSREEHLARRMAFLAAYQDDAYAARYRALVDRVRAAEAAVTANRTLTDAVIAGAFKLMAYKDEYEVARLLSDPAFHAALAAQFEDGYRIKFNLAPPILGGPPDERTGRPRKRAFGKWLLPFLRVLARGKFLRGTALDPFGRTAERRRERALIAEYEATIEQLCRTLSPANHAKAVQIAALPATIRGFGPVKEMAIENAAGERRRLLEEYTALRG